MEFHDRICFRKNPHLAKWGGIVFGSFGIMDLLGRHHGFQRTPITIIGFAVMTACFLFQLPKARCAIERFIIAIVSAIGTISLCATVMGPAVFFKAKLLVMCGWFLASAACVFWSVIVRRRTAG